MVTTAELRPDDKTDDAKSETGSHNSSELDWDALRERGLATSIDELPPLREGFARGVRIASQESVPDMLEKGVDYRVDGMLTAVASLSADPNDIYYTSDDPRFGEGKVSVVFDLSFAETKQHNRLGSAPGILSPDHIIGVVDPYRQPSQGQMPTEREITPSAE